MTVMQLCQHFIANYFCVCQASAEYEAAEDHQGKTLVAATGEADAFPGWPPATTSQAQNSLEQM